MIVMAEKHKTTSDEKALGPSIILGLVGAIVVLLVLAGAIWGVGKLISKIRENGGDEEREEQSVAEDTTQENEDTENGTEDNGEIPDEAATEEPSKDETSSSETADEENQEDSSEPSEGEETQEGTDSTSQEEAGTVPMEVIGDWIANNYVSGDITGDKYTVVWGDTLWEIAEAKYGSGFEWKKIQSANEDIVGSLPNGSLALIIPGQVLDLP
jgi:nucleoid-associated protein YgaU